MKNLWTVFGYEMRRNLRRSGYLFGTFGIPALALLALLVYQFVVGRGIISANPFPDDDQISLGSFNNAGYVDLSGLIDRAVDTSLRRYPDEAAARAALEAGEIDVYFVIAADYLESGQVTLALPTLRLDQLGGAAVQALLLDALAERIDDPLLFERLSDPANFEEINLQAARQQAQNVDTLALVVTIFTLTLLFSVLTTNSYMMQTVIEEKETRLIEILMSSVTPTALLAGKILAFGLLGLLQIGVWLGVLALMFRIGGGGALGPAIAMFVDLTIPLPLVLWMLIYFVLTYLLFAAGFSIIGVLTNSAREGSQYTVVLVLPLVAPMWFQMVFITTPDSPLAVILSLIPITAPLSMVQRLVIADVPLWQLTLSVCLLALTTFSLMWLAGRVFRVQALLAGQPPKLRDLPRLLRA